MRITTEQGFDGIQVSISIVKVGSTSRMHDALFGKRCTLIIGQARLMLVEQGVNFCGKAYRIAIQTKIHETQQPLQHATALSRRQRAETTSRLNIHLPGFQSLTHVGRQGVSHRPQRVQKRDDSTGGVDAYFSFGDSRSMFANGILDGPLHLGRQIRPPGKNAIQDRQDRVRHGC